MATPAVAPVLDQVARPQVAPVGDRLTQAQLDQGGGDLMVDATAATTGWWFLVGVQTVQIEGKVVNTKGAR